jgi:ubiquinone/menaquinone biosynthesis C-methylase UbiE
MNNHSIHNTAERLIPQHSDLNTFYEHAYRYAFACKYLKGACVLDIASGEGYGTYCISKIAKNVVGVDICKESVELAKVKYGLDYRLGDAENIPLESNSIDVVVSFETIEHIANPDKFINEVNRVLKKNGKLIISTPNKDIYHHNQESNSYHLSEMTQLEFQQCLEKFFKINKLMGQVFANKNLVSTETSLNSFFKSYIKQKMKSRFWPDFVITDPNQLTQMINRIPRLHSLVSRFCNPYITRNLNSKMNGNPMYLIAYATKR